MIPQKGIVSSVKTLRHLLREMAVKAIRAKPVGPTEATVIYPTPGAVCGPNSVRYVFCTEWNSDSQFVSVIPS